MVRSGRTFLCQWVRSMIYLYTGFLLDWMCVLFSLLSSDREFMKQPLELNQDPTTLGSCWGRFIVPFCCFCSPKFGVPGTSSTGNASWPSWRSMSHPKSWKPTTDSPRVAPTGTLGRHEGVSGPSFAVATSWVSSFTLRTPNMRPSHRRCPDNSDVADVEQFRKFAVASVKS